MPSCALSALLLALAAAACVPLARDPVGGRAVAVVDPAISGEWRTQDDDGEVIVRIGRGGPSPRDVKIVVREPGASGVRESEYGALLTRAGGIGWLNVRYEEAGRSGWLPLRYALDGPDRIRVRFPDTARMAKAIEGRQLAGSAERAGIVTSVELTGTGKELAAALTAPAAAGWYLSERVFDRVPAAPAAP